MSAFSFFLMPTCGIWEKLTIYWGVTQGDIKKQGDPLYFRQKRNRARLSLRVRLSWFVRVRN